MKKLLCVFVAVAVLMAVAIGAYAAGASMKVEATMELGMNIKLDGEVQTFTDANGNVVYPLVYQGTTYLPVRAVCGLAGIPVQWDQETYSVLLGSSEDKKVVGDAMFRGGTSYYVEGEYTTDPGKLIVDGTGYPSGIVGSYQFSYGDTKVGENIARIATDKKYSVFHAILATDKATKVTFSNGSYYDDPVVYKEVELNAGEVTEVSFSIVECDTLHINLVRLNGAKPENVRIVDMWVK